MDNVQHQQSRRADSKKMKYLKSTIPDPWWNTNSDLREAVETGAARLEDTMLSASHDESGHSSKPSQTSQEASLSLIGMN